MASLVYLKNKKTGIIYVYENISVWNKEKKRANCKRKCVGKLDPATGKLIPNGNLWQEGGKQSYARSIIVGDTMLFEKIANETGLKELLSLSFPDELEAILTCAYYLVSEGKPLSHCETWSACHENPFGKRLANQRVSELLACLTRERQIEFFHKWIALRTEQEYIALDITSVSSYSEQNEYARYGYNRDGDNLPQVNMCMLLGDDSGLPVYYEVLPGSINDVVTLKGVIDMMKFMDAKRMHLVMDKGFYSENNINALYDAHYRFTVAVSFTTAWAKELVKSVRGEIEAADNYCCVNGKGLFAVSRTDKWGKHRCYRHVFYDSQKAAIEYMKFIAKLDVMRQELEENRPEKKHQGYYDKYFEIKEMPKLGRKVKILNERVQEFKERTCGFFVLLSNDIKDPVRALKVYRDKDAVEKGFDDMKNELDTKRLRIHSQFAMEGRIFIQFIALIIISAIRNHMAGKGLSARYTLPELVNEMKSLHKVTVSGRKKPIHTEPTKAQREIMNIFGL